MASSKIVLGIDCGTATTGWAILEKCANKLIALAYGAILTSKNDVMPLRLKIIHEELTKIVNKYQPQEMAVEQLYFFKNKTTVIPVGQARGIALLCAGQANIPVFDYTPMQVKQAVTGYGKSEKKQVQKMVTKILNLRQIPKPDDTADAIAVAICHLNTNQIFINRK